jgi:hypothetical protein
MARRRDSKGRFVKSGHKARKRTTKKSRSRRKRR